MLCSTALFSSFLTWIPEYQQICAYIHTIHTNIQIENNGCVSSFPKPPSQTAFFRMYHQLTDNRYTIFLHAILWYAGMLDVLLLIIRRRRAGGRYYWMTTNILMTRIPHNVCCLLDVAILIDVEISTMTIGSIGSIRLAVPYDIFIPYGNFLIIIIIIMKPTDTDPMPIDRHFCVCNVFAVQPSVVSF